MSQPFVGEIRMFGGNFAPVGWMFCEGQLLAISQNTTLFQLIGTTYGGDGQSTFALPDLRGRIPIHQGQSGGTSQYTLAENGGVEQVTLTVSQIPTHNHVLQASSGGTPTTSPAGNQLAAGGADMYYVNLGKNTSMNAGAVANTGGSQPHTNFQPYLCVSFIISLFGIFPSQT